MRNGITVRLFGELAGIVGRNNVFLPFTEPLTVGGVIEELLSLYPDLLRVIPSGAARDSIRECLLVAVGQKELRLEDEVHPGDTVLLATPPVGG